MASPSITFSDKWCRIQSGRNLVRLLPQMPDIIETANARFEVSSNERRKAPLELISIGQVPYLPMIPRKEDTTKIIREMNKHEKEHVAIVPNIGTFDEDAVRMLQEVGFSKSRG
jgi:hypothetical protein